MNDIRLENPLVFNKLKKNVIKSPDDRELHGLIIIGYFIRYFSEDYERFYDIEGFLRMKDFQTVPAVYQAPLSI